MAAPATVEQVSLVRERQPTRVEPGAELPQAAGAAARVLNRDLGIHRRITQQPQPRGVHPQGPGVAYVGGMQVGGGAIRGHLLSRREDGQREEGSEGRAASHYGRTVMVERVIWCTGTVMPCIGKPTTIAELSWASPPR